MPRDTKRKLMVPGAFTSGRFVTASILLALSFSTVRVTQADISPVNFSDFSSSIEFSSNETCQGQCSNPKCLDDCTDLCLDDRQAYCGNPDQLCVQQSAPWHLDRIDQINGGPVFDHTFSPLECRCGKGVVIYIIGSAVRPTHDEFGGRASNGQVFSSIDLSGLNSEEMEPGTSIASMASGSAFGVAKCSQVVAIPVVDLINEVPTISTKSLELALQYVLNDTASNTDKRAVIILPPFTIPQVNEKVIDLIASAYENNVPIILPSGNEVECEAEDQLSKFVLRVGALTNEDKPAMFSTQIECVEVWAPGSNVRAASAEGDQDDGLFSGVSLAAGLAAGTAALLLESDPQLTTSDVYTRILRSMTLSLEEDPGVDTLGESGYPFRILNAGSSNVLPFLCKVCDSFLRAFEEADHYSVMEEILQYDRAASCLRECISNPVSQGSTNQFGNADVYHRQLNDNIIAMVDVNTMEIIKLFQLDTFNFLYVKDPQTQVVVSNTLKQSDQSFDWVFQQNTLQILRISLKSSGQIIYNFNTTNGDVEVFDLDNTVNGPQILVTVDTATLNEISVQDPTAVETDSQGPKQAQDPLTGLVVIKPKSPISSITMAATSVVSQIYTDLKSSQLQRFDLLDNVTRAFIDTAFVEETNTDDQMSCVDYLLDADDSWFAYFQAIAQSIVAYLKIEAIGECPNDLQSSSALQDCQSVCDGGNCDEAIRCCKQEALAVAIGYFNSSTPEGRNLEDLKANVSVSSLCAAYATVPLSVELERAKAYVFLKKATLDHEAAPASFLDSNTKNSYAALLYDFLQSLFVNWSEGVTADGSLNNTLAFATPPLETKYDAVLGLFDPEKVCGAPQWTLKAFAPQNGAEWNMQTCLQFLPESCCGGIPLGQVEETCLEDCGGALCSTCNPQVCESWCTALEVPDEAKESEVVLDLNENSVEETASLTFDAGAYTVNSTSQQNPIVKYTEDGGAYIVFATTATGMYKAQIGGKTLNNQPHYAQKAVKGAEDVFIVRVNNNGEKIFATYFGGNGITASSNFPSSSGTLNVSASSAQCESIMQLISEDLDLPKSVLSKPLPARAEAACQSDVFIAQFDNEGSLVASQLFGGPGADIKPSLALSTSVAGLKVLLSFQTFDAASFLLESDGLISFNQTFDVPSDMGVVGTVKVQMSLENTSPFLEVASTELVTLESYNAYIPDKDYIRSTVYGPGSNLVVGYDGADVIVFIDSNEETSEASSTAYQTSSEVITVVTVRYPNEETNDLVLPIGDLGITNIQYAKMTSATEILLIGEFKQMNVYGNESIGGSEGASTAHGGWDIVVMKLSILPDSIEKAPICRSAEEILDENPLPWSTSMCDPCFLPACYQESSIFGSSDLSPASFKSNFSCCAPASMLNDTIYDNELSIYDLELNTDGVQPSFDNQTLTQLKSDPNAMANSGIVIIGEKVHPRQIAFPISLFLSDTNISEETAEKDDKEVACSNIGYVLDCLESFCVNPEAFGDGFCDDGFWNFELLSCHEQEQIDCSSPSNFISPSGNSSSDCFETWGTAAITDDNGNCALSSFIGDGICDKSLLQLYPDEAIDCLFTCEDQFKSPGYLLSTHKEPKCAVPKSSATEFYVKSKVIIGGSGDERVTAVHVEPENLGGNILIGATSDSTDEIVDAYGGGFGVGLSDGNEPIIIKLRNDLEKQYIAAPDTPLHIKFIHAITSESDGSVQFFATTSEDESGMQMKQFDASPVECVSGCPQIGFTGCASYKSNLEPFTQPGICLPCRNKPDSQFTHYIDVGSGTNNCPWTCSVPNLGTYSFSYYNQLAESLRIVSAYAEATSSYNTQPLRKDNVRIDSGEEYFRQRSIDYIDVHFDVSHSEMWGCPTGFGASDPQNYLQIRLTSNIFSNGNFALHKDFNFSQDTVTNGSMLVPLDLPILPSTPWQLSIEKMPLGQNCVESNVETAEVCLIPETASNIIDESCHITLHVRCFSIASIWSAPGLPLPSIGIPANPAPSVEIIDKPLNITEPLQGPEGNSNGDGGGSSGNSSSAMLIPLVVVLSAIVLIAVIVFVIKARSYPITRNQVTTRRAELHDRV